MDKKERLQATQLNDEFVPVYSDKEIILEPHEFIEVKVYLYKEILPFLCQ